MMWKIEIIHSKEEIYYSFEWYGQYPGEQTGCRKETKGTDDVVYIDQHIFKEAKTRREDVAMSWIDYKTSNDIISQI